MEDIGLEHSKTLRASVMELEIFEPEGGAPLAAQLGGEEWPPHAKVRIDVAPRALRLLVPKPTRRCPNCSPVPWLARDVAESRASETRRAKSWASGYP
jgi:hypothetical protein